MENINYNYVEKIKNGGYRRIVGVAENILLRYDDSVALMMGKEKFNALKEAEEKILEEYKDDDIYKYYYGFNEEKHGFCNFERFKAIYLCK